MAQTSWPFENIDTTETQFSQWARNINEGIRQGSGSELVVGAPGGAMTVTVGTGQAMIRGHYYSSDAVETLTIAAADATNPRIDSVVLELDPTANTVILKVLTGTPAGSPTAPSLTQTDAGIYQIRLANVLVGTGVLQIVSGNITDLRTYMFAGIGKWTTATRPANPVQYQTTGYNTDLNTHEFWNGSSWVGFADPITTRGDLIVGGVSGVPTRLAIGANDKVLKSNGTDVVWGDAGGGGYYFEFLSDGTKTVSVPEGYYAWGFTNGTYSFNNNLGSGYGPSGTTNPRLDYMTQLTGVTVGGVINTWTTRLSGFGNDSRSLAYNNSNSYVASYMSIQTYLQSTDGITWVSRQLPATGGTGIVWNGTYFVGSMQQTYAIYSTDGITWSTSNSGGFTFSVAHGNGFTILGGQNNVIRYSNNGITWTSSTISFGGQFNTFYAAVYGSHNGRWLFMGSDGSYASTTSTSFNTWSTGQLATFPQIQSLSYGNNTYIAGGSNGQIFTSTDAITWTQRTSPATASLTMGFYFDGTRWLGSGPSGSLIFSTDAITWTTQFNGKTVTPNASTNPVGAIGKFGSTYIATGARISTTTNIEGIVRPARLAFLSAGPKIEIS